jgi:solute carrier family 50 protein (sugar transporter)
MIILWSFLSLIIVTCEGVGIGAGVRLMVPAAPSVPLGVTSIQDSASVNTTSSVGADPVTVDSQWKIYAETFLKIMGTVSNIVLQLSPLRIVTDMRMKKSVLGLSPAPLIALTACGYQWSFYGYFAYITTDNIGFLTLVYANILGLVLGMYYLITFTVYCDKQSSDSLLTYGFLSLIIFSGEAIYCFLESDPSKTLLCAGIISAILSILVSFSPMISLRTALRNISISALPVDIIVASFVSCLLWSLLGLLLHDPWVLIPNSAGLVLGLIQLLAVAFICVDIKKIDYRRQWIDKIHSLVSRRDGATGETII